MAERVWDRFLTAQDQAHLALSRDRRVGFGQRPALLLIDLYRWVFGDAPQPLLDGLADWPGYCGMAGWNALPHIQALIRGAREAGIPVVHVTGLHPDQAGVVGWNEAAHGGESRSASSDPLVRDRVARMYDIVDEVAPIPGEAVLRKSAPSAFSGTPLAAHLNYLGVDSLLVAGESTSGCVRASVVEGCTYRYKMIVAEECVFDRHEACHAINLFDMHQKYADVLPLAEILDYLRAYSAKSAAREPVGARA